ncbi:hypothetical protein AAG570_002137 [Ranatra chinensis]|uniref:Uncharacterized protein n=1 Tax=Ranatra chinensis TaxID=642074 RepID=A0ABD0Y8P3_9HEMI
MQHNEEALNASRRQTFSRPEMMVRACLWGAVVCALVGLCCSLVLECPSNGTIDVEESLDIQFPAEGAAYPARLKCNWTFVGRSILAIKFEKMDLKWKRNGTKVICFEFVKLRHENRDVFECRKPNKVHSPGNETLHLQFLSSDGGTGGFKARIWNKCPKSWVGCNSDLEEKHPGSDTVLAYRIEAFDSPEESYSTSTDLDRVVRGEVTLDMITFGKDRLSVACLECNRIILPTSQTPSCHFGDADNCEWLAILGQVFVDSYRADEVGMLVTMNEDLELDSVCLYIEHASDTPFSTYIFVVTGWEHFNLEGLKSGKGRGERWNVTKLEGRVPTKIVGKKAILQLVFLGSVTVRKIYGCEVGREETRVRLFRDARFHGKIRGLDGPKLEKSANCLNGGRLEGDGEACRCPAGVTGARCETSCGPDRLGPACEAHCSGLEAGCKGLLLCKAGLGCMCAPGFKGFRCTVSCHSSEYGPGCALPCGRCAGHPQGRCDRFTGHCHHGCVPGYVPPLCQDVFVHFKTAPRVEASYDNAMLIADFNDIRGFGTPKYFQIQTRKKSSYIWSEKKMSLWPLILGAYKINVTDLDPGTEYQVRIVVFDSDLNKYDGDKIRVASFWTLCRPSYDLKIVRTNSTDNSVFLNWANKSADKYACPPNNTIVEIFENDQWTVYAVKGYSLNITSLGSSKSYKVRLRAQKASNPVLAWLKIQTKPRVTGQVAEMRITNVLESSAILQWKALSGYNNASFNITYQCDLLLANESEPCGHDTGSVVSVSTSQKLTRLKPFRRYRVSVREIPGTEFTRTVFTTKDSLPTTAPVLKEVHAEKTEIRVMWSRPANSSDLNGVFKSYHYTLTRDETVIMSSTALSGTLRFYQLKPSTKYTVNAYITNHLGWSKKYPLTVEAETLPSAPGPPSLLEAYMTGPRQIGLRWARPQDSNGRLVGFLVRTDDREERVDAMKPCVPWPDKFCYTLVGLEPKRDYTLKLSLKNDMIEEFGSEAILTVRTEEDAPEAPLDLIVVEATQSSMVLRWRPPPRFWGILRSFTIVAEQTDSHHPLECCALRIKRDVRVDEIREFYSEEMDGLRPASKYSVSVLAQTILPGMPMTVKAITRPPKARVTLPQTDLPISWARATDTLTDTPLLETNLLLQLDSTEKLARYSIDDPDLLDTIRLAVGGWFHVLEEYADDRNISLKNLKRNSKSRYGNIVNNPLEHGVQYTFAAVAISRYEYLYNAVALKSKPFKIT